MSARKLIRGVSHPVSADVYVDGEYQAGVGDHESLIRENENVHAAHHRLRRCYGHVDDEHRERERGYAQGDRGDAGGRDSQLGAGKCRQP